jgi:hypothetical protein
MKIFFQDFLHNVFLAVKYQSFVYLSPAEIAFLCAVGFGVAGLSAMAIRRALFLKSYHALSEFRGWPRRRGSHVVGQKNMDIVAHPPVSLRWRRFVVSRCPETAEALNRDLEAINQVFTFAEIKSVERLGKNVVFYF